MTWATFYLVCLIAGFGMSLLSVLTGFDHVHLPFHGHGHFHVPHVDHGHAGGVHGGDLGRIASFNFSALMAFVAWFGGCGYLLTTSSTLAIPVVMLIAFLTGLAGAAIVNAFLVKVLTKREHELEGGSPIGRVATVSMPIREGGTGEIIYLLNETRQSSGARSDNGTPIAAGSEVFITRFEDGISYVRPTASLLSDPAHPVSVLPPSTNP